MTQIVCTVLRQWNAMYDKSSEMSVYHGFIKFSFGQCPWIHFAADKEVCPLFCVREDCPKEP